LFETPESREQDWKKDPAAAFRRTWFFHHFEFSPRKSTETTMLRVRKAEIEQSVGRSEGKGPTKMEEYRIFPYTVRATGVMEDGSPYVEIVLPDLNAVWNAILLPKEKKMKLFKDGFYVGLYGVE
jgi:hypothetical protein